jgi:hypothetical protein
LREKRLLCALSRMILYFYYRIILLVSLDKIRIFSLHLLFSLRISGNRRNRSARVGGAEGEGIAEISPRMVRFGLERISRDLCSKFNKKQIGVTVNSITNSCVSSLSTTKHHMPLAGLFYQMQFSKSLKDLLYTFITYIA